MVGTFSWHQACVGFAWTLCNVQETILEHSLYFPKHPRMDLSCQVDACANVTEKEACWTFKKGDLAVEIRLPRLVEFVLRVIRGSSYLILQFLPRRGVVTTLIRVLLRLK